MEYDAINSIIDDETVISPKLHSSNSILRYVRAMSNAHSLDDIRAVYRLVNNKAEAMELSVHFDAPYLDKTLAEMPFKKGVLIACIRRGSRIIFPRGTDSINAGDTIIAFTTAENHISGFKDLFER